MYRNPKQLHNVQSEISMTSCKVPIKDFGTMEYCEDFVFIFTPQLSSNYLWLRKQSQSSLSPSTSPNTILARRHFESDYAHDFHAPLGGMSGELTSRSPP